MENRDSKAFLDSGVGKLNDYSDVDIGKLQYTSDILETMKQDGYYDDLVKTVSALSFANKSKSFIVRMLKQKYPMYCGALSVGTFNRWLEYYVDLSRAFNFNRLLCLGELVYMGMKKAERSIDNPKDDFIVKLLDRLDDGTVSHKNKPEIIEQQANACSSQTANTISRILAEASRFGGLDNVSVDDSDLEGDDDSEVEM